MAQKSRGRALRRRALLKRFGLTGAKAAVLACAAVVIVLVVLTVVRSTLEPGVVIERTDSEEAQASEGAEDTAEESTPTPTLVVHVDGAVSSPGVYTLSGEGLRVIDAVEAAGGLTEEADTSTVNLAASLSDGEKLHIPAVGETVQTTQSTAEQSGSTAGVQVNINTADAEALKTLPGIGDATAAAIIEDREKNGPFSTPEDLMRVSGIGEKKFAKLKDQICV